MKYLEVKYKERNPEGHFFDKDTMRFFKSKIGAEFWNSKEECFFITSEQFENNPRGFTVRKLELNGNINTIGEFNVLTKYKAEKLAKQLSLE